MRYNIKTIVYLSCLLILLSVNVEVRGGIVLEYSTDIDYTSDTTLPILKTNITRDRRNSSGIDSASQSPAWLLSERNIYVNGYDKGSNGLQYFSFDTDVVVQGPFGTMTVLSNSILKCDDVACANVSIYFTFDRHVNIDAFTIGLGGNIYFSVDQSTTIEGLTVFPADIIKFNLDASNYTIDMNSQTSIGGMTLGVDKNIDAISQFSVSSGTGYIYSLKDSGCFTTTGLCYTNNDIFYIVQSSGSHFIYHSPEHFGEYENPVNISSLLYLVLAEGIFSDGFE